MGERGLTHRLLERPLVYSLSQAISAPGANLILGKHFSDVFGQSRGLVLDVGCGPSLTSPQPRGILIGLDLNTSYVEKYIRGHGGGKTRANTRLGVVATADSLPFSDNVFDEIRSLGLLHHLPNVRAVSTIREMFRCTRRGGKIIIFDNVWPRIPLLRPVAWLSRKIDRGAWIRSESELVRLASVAYPGRWLRKRFTYSFTGLEGLILSLSKKDD